MTTIHEEACPLNLAPTASTTAALALGDGDLRRLMKRDDAIGRRTAAEIMTRGPVTLPGEVPAAAALQVMEARRITSVPTVDVEVRPRGVLHIHDLWRTDLI